MADWSAFATAFLNDTAGYINERKDKAAEYEDEQREMLEASRLKLDKKRQISDTAYGIANRLKSQGLSEEVIRAAAASGPTGLVDLNRKWDEAVTQFGPNFAQENPELVTEVVSTSMTADQLGMTGDNKSTLDEFLKRTYGLSAPSTGSYEAQDTGFLGKLMGYGAKDRVRAKLDAEDAGGGYSVYDLNQAARAAEYESLAPGAAVSYGAPKMFTAEDLAAETRALDGQMDIARGTNEYKALDVKLTAADKRIAELQGYGESLGETEKAELVALTEKRQGLVQEQNAIVESVLSDFVDNRKDLFFGNSYMDQVGNMYDTLVGSRGASQAFYPTEEDQKLEGAGAVETDPLSATSEVEQPTATSVETPEVTTNELPSGEVRTDPAILNGTSFTLDLDADGNEVMVLRQGMVAADGTVVPIGTVIPADQTATLLNPPEPAAPAPSAYNAEEIAAFRERNGNMIPMSEEEFDALSRSEKEALGLPISPLGKGVKLRFVAPTYRDSMQRRAEPDPEAFYEVVLPQFAGRSQVFKVRGQNLKYIPEVRLAADMETAIIGDTIEGDTDLRTMSAARLKRKYGTEEDSAGIMSPTEDAPTVETPAEPTEAAPEEDVRKSDAMTDSVLKKHGQDIVAYFKKEGITADSDPEEKLYALADWATETGVMLPFDKESLMYGIDFGLNL